jgi:anti-sigma factor ChrR (cupin superfamily)
MSSPSPLTCSSSINSDFSVRVVLPTLSLAWYSSPSPFVDRRFLDRIGGEQARATSIVRYAPSSTFPSHIHHGGEEFIVLSGIFSDEHGDYPAGSYVRNPPLSSHAPHSKEGCEILVKLRQFQSGDDSHVFIRDEENSYEISSHKGIKTLKLHEFGSEQIELQMWENGAIGPSECVNEGEELFIISGEFEDEHGIYSTGTWIRNPKGFCRSFKAIQQGKMWRKSGNLGYIAK